MYSFISDKSIINSFKGSKYFKVDLGSTFTSTGKDGIKMDFTKQTDFIQNYFGKYNSKLYKEGSIGAISFYTDWTIKNEVRVYYDDDNDFVFEHSDKIMKEKGVDAYLGGLIKKIETELIPSLQPVEKVGKSISKEEQVENAINKIKNSPGSVSYDDIKDYLKTKKLRR